eukprot:TRINITY_DN25338_c0_g1_i1.p1 TRINITY_DN25338_c0_g1~~TRINITY_DN25338_c0_g1_i1.p1  ORF type:complete len:261 (+),score=46.78 TRINITY_DN25338_c0_g1_i1:164-946(+)
MSDAAARPADGAASPAASAVSPRASEAGGGDTPVRPSSPQATVPTLSPILPSRKVRRCIATLAAAEHRRWRRQFGHHSSFGKQVDSTRQSQPVRKFGGASTGRMPAPLPAEPPLAEHFAREKLRESKNPPKELPYRPFRVMNTVTDAPVQVLRGWGHGQRFLTDLPQSSLKRQPAPPKVAKAVASFVKANDDAWSKKDDTLDVGRPSRPEWSFGSSGLGCRFKPGTRFSRRTPVKPSSRLAGFRDLRDALPPEAGVAPMK